MLRRLWEGWKLLAEKIGTVQAKLILGLLYFVIVGPIALVRRLWADSLGLRRTAAATYWSPRPHSAPTLEEARRQ